MELVVVDWYDAHSNDPWHTYPCEYEPYIVRSVGFVDITKLKAYLESADDNDVGLTLIPNYTPDGTACFGTVHIPAQCIKQLQVIPTHEVVWLDGDEDWVLKLMS